MSGIYIPGMEMPTSCDKCIHSAWSNFYQIYVCNAVRKNEPVLFDGKQTKSTAVARSARADNCPLISVPEHGDLIDRDALMKDGWLNLHKEVIRMGGYAVHELPLTNPSIPAVIPADKEGEG